MAKIYTEDFTLGGDSNERLKSLCGHYDEHLKLIERRLGVEISNRANHFRVMGNEETVEQAKTLLEKLYNVTEKERLTSPRVHLYLQEAGLEAMQQTQDSIDGEETGIRTKRGVIKGRGANQINYLKAIQGSDLCFGVGPAGTGKTYLAVASAVEALDREEVRRLILIRPAVEAGENLGFLPGDLAQKIDPYLRPIYDALNEMMGFERVNKLMERGVIEIAPLAYMRGRTLNESFIILDEAQNTTAEQMKMFLTRIGYGTTAVVTGDVTQVDLPKNKTSGLRHVIEVLREVDGVSFTFFQPKDVVRHPLVKRIVQAYDKADTLKKSKL